MTKEQQNNKSSYIFGKWCELTTCVGIIDWHTAETKWRKFIWILVIIFFMIVSTIFTFIVISDFALDTRYKTSLWLQAQNDMSFPNVTICNYNRAMKSKMERIGLTHEALSFAYGSLPLGYDLPLTVMSENLSTYEESWMDFLSVHPEYSDIKKLLYDVGYDCVLTFWTCQFAGVTFSCCDFVTEVVTTYGKCFILTPPTFNGSSLRQMTPGASQGMKFIIDPQTHEYTPDVVENNFLQAGFIIGISYVYQPLFPEPILLAPGAHAWVSLRKVVETVKWPNITLSEVPCRKNTTLQLLDADYTKQNCYFDCLLVDIVNKCNCTPMSDFKIAYYPICNGTFMYQCFGQVLKSTENNYGSCVTKCITPCRPTVSVSASVSTVKTPSTNLDNTVYNFLNHLNVPAKRGSKPAAVDIYFPRLEIINAETAECQSIFMFVSNVGGQLSLCLGISAITIVQAIYYIVEYFAVRIKERKTTTVQPAPSSPRQSARIAARVTYIEPIRG